MERRIGIRWLARGAGFLLAGTVAWLWARSGEEDRPFASEVQSEAAQSPVAAPAVPSPAPTPVLPVQPPASPDAGSTSEEQILAALRAEVSRNPALALELAAEGERRFPQGRHLGERAFLKVKALVNLQRIGEARREARRFLEANPNHPYSEDVSALTGVHPRPPPFPFPE